MLENGKLNKQQQGMLFRNMTMNTKKKKASRKIELLPLGKENHM